VTSPFRYHVFICGHNGPDWLSSCGGSGGNALLESFKREITERGLEDAVFVGSCSCTGLCERGPVVIITPPGKWYTRVAPEDVQRIIDSHIIGGKTLEGRDDPDFDTLKNKMRASRKISAEESEEQRHAGFLPASLDSKITGFMQSRIILSAVELDIFGALRGKSAGSEEIAGRLELDPRATDILLNALSAMGLLNKKNGLFSNSEMAAAFLSGESFRDSRAALMHRIHQFDSWSRLSEVVRNGSPSGFVKMQDRQKQWTETFIAAMHRNGSYRARKIAKILDLDGIERMLDLGGGSGAYSIAFAQVAPGLKSVVFDIPNVTPITQRYILQAGLSDRIITADGDMHCDDYGSGFDMVFISAICHMNSPEENIEIFHRSALALKTGGRIVVGDFIMNEDKVSPLTGSLFAVNMLVATKAGNSYSYKEYSDWLTACGFDKIRRIDIAAPAGLIEAIKVV